MSKCTMSKTHPITKICRCQDHTDTFHTWLKRSTIIIYVLLILIFYQLSRIYAKLFKTLLLMKNSFNKVQKKHCKRGDCQYENFQRITYKTIFWTFWFHKTIFITLQYSGNILGMFLKQKSVECSSNILETLLCDYWNLPKDQHLLLSNHTLLTQKQHNHWEFHKKYFPLKCSPKFLWMPGTLQHWENTQRIFPEYCVPAG